MNRPLLAMICCLLTLPVCTGRCLLAQSFLASPLANRVNPQPEVFSPIDYQPSAAWFQSPWSSQQIGAVSLVDQSPALNEFSRPVAPPIVLDNRILENQPSTWQRYTNDISTPSPFQEPEFIDTPPLGFPGRLGQDIRNFYSGQNLWRITLVASLGATLANTTADEQVRDFVAENVVSTACDEWVEALHFNKEIGNGAYTLPVFAIAASTEYLPLFKESLRPASRWGDRSLRTFLVGAPFLVAAQELTGGSRPGESPHTSHWAPFQDNNGVSGHAFMGAIPFLAASDLTDNPWIHGSLLAASTLPGLSRVSDDHHYFSQVVMGWSFSYLAYQAVAQTDQKHHRWRVRTWSIPRAQGIGWEYRW